MTFTELVAASRDPLNLTSPESATRVGILVNTYYKRVTSAIGLNLTRRTTVQTNATIGVSSLIFAVEKIINVVDRSTTPHRRLTEITMEEMRARGAGAHSSPQAYAIEAVGASTSTILMDCVPQTAFTLYADGYAQATVLSGSQIPAFPEDFHDVIVHGVLAEEYRKMGKLAASKDAKNDYEQRLSDLKFFIAKSSYSTSYHGKTKNGLTSGGSTAGSGGSSVNGADSYTQTGLITFDRSGAGAADAPFAVVAGANKVDNLDADLLDGETGSAFHNATNLNAGTVPDARFPATLPAISGANLTNLDATDLTGSIALARLANGTTTLIQSSTVGAQNNWAPGIVGNTLISWSGASSLAVTGLLAGVSVGQLVTFINASTAQIATFAYNSGSSSAGNKLFNLVTSGLTPIAPGGHATWVWVSAGTGWQMIAHDQGAWITPTFAAGNYTGNASMTWTLAAGDVTSQCYKLSQKTLTVAFEINTSSVGGTPSTRLQIGTAAWGSFTPTKAMWTAAALLQDNSVLAAGFIAVAVSGTVIQIGKSSLAAWTAATDATLAYGQISFEVT